MSVVTASYPTELPFEPGTLTPSSFLPLYTAFLHAFHATGVHRPDTPPGEKSKPICKLSDHLARFEQPPMFEGRTFNIYDFFDIIRHMGGFRNVTSWTDLCRKVNMNPAKSNISTRLREWADKHHIVPFFDFVMGIPNDFYRELRDDEVVGNIKIEKEEGTVLETDQEMWLRLYGLDGGLTTRKRKVPPPPPVLAPSVAASVSTPSASASLDPSSTVKRAHDSTHTNEHLTSAMKRRRFESDRIVLIGGVPHASLSVEEQKILNDVNAKIKSHSGNEAAIKSEDAIVSFGSESKSISSAGIVVAKEEGVVLIPSVQPRLDIVRASLETLKEALAVSVEGSGSHSNASLTEDKTETEKLKTEVLGLVELMKGQQQIIESLRRRIGALDE